MTELEQLQHGIRIARIVIPILFTLDVLLLVAWATSKIRLDRSRSENAVLKSACEAYRKISEVKWL